MVKMNLKHICNRVVVLFRPPNCEIWRPKQNDHPFAEDLSTQGAGTLAIVVLTPGPILLIWINFDPSMVK